MELFDVLERFILAILTYLERNRTCLFHDEVSCSHFFSFSVRLCLKRSVFYLQIRTLGMLRSRFQSLPGAFNARLVPNEKSETTKKRGFMATFFRKFNQVWLLLLYQQMKHMPQTTCFFYPFFWIELHLKLCYLW